jgi:hypothetical protein
LADRKDGLGIDHLFCGLGLVQNMRIRDERHKNVFEYRQKPICLKIGIDAFECLKMHVQLLVKLRDKVIKRFFAASPLFVDINFSEACFLNFFKPELVNFLIFLPHTTFFSTLSTPYFLKQSFQHIISSHPVTSSHPNSLFRPTLPIPQLS